MMKIVNWGAAVLLAAGVTMLQAQTPAAAPKPAAAKPAAAAAKPVAVAPAQPSPVDSVIESVKAGLSEGLIIKTLQRENKPAKLATSDLVKLQKAGVSENIINTMLDPAAAPTPAPAPVAATPAPALAPMAAPAAPAPTAAQTAAAAQAQKKRAVVDEFDYSAVMTSVQAVFGTQQNIGKGIRAMLVKRIVMPIIWWLSNAPKSTS